MDDTFMGIPKRVDERVPLGHVYLVNEEVVLADVTVDETYLKRLVKYVTFALENDYLLTAVLFPPEGRTDGNLD